LNVSSVDLQTDMMAILAISGCRVHQVRPFIRTNIVITLSRECFEEFRQGIFIDQKMGPTRIDCFWHHWVLMSANC